MHLPIFFIRTQERFQLDYVEKSGKRVKENLFNMVQGVQVSV